MDFWNIAGKVGFILLLFGGGAMDSECLVAPITMIAVGCILISGQILHEKNIAEGKNIHYSNGLEPRYRFKDKE